MKYCICDDCGMEFKIQRLDEKTDTMKDGHKVRVLSFTCPKCDNEYIVSVMDEQSAQLRKEWKAAQEEHQNSSGDKLRITKNEMEFRKKKMFTYMNRLKKHYLKELRRRGH